MAKKEQPLRKVSLPDAVSEAFCELQELAQEMRDWADNLEEKFSATAKYETVSSTADTLEQHEEPSPPENLPALEVHFTDLPQRKRGYSRSDRCGQACYILDQCFAELDAEIDRLETEDKNSNTDLIDTLSEYRDEIGNVRDDCEGCEFPGMYG